MSVTSCASRDWPDVSRRIWPAVLRAQGWDGVADMRELAGRLGERVAAPGVTVVDDGTLAGRRGSLNVDDEGTSTRRAMLVEKGMADGMVAGAAADVIFLSV